MTPNDIKVGQLYGHKVYPNNFWLGAGKRKPWTFWPNVEFTEKHLVCIKNPDSPYGSGLIFKTPDDEEGAYDEDWELFYEVNE